MSKLAGAMQWQSRGFPGTSGAGRGSPSLSPGRARGGGDAGFRPSRDGCRGTRVGRCRGTRRDRSGRRAVGLAARSRAGARPRWLSPVRCRRVAAQRGWWWVEAPHAEEGG
ncbi:hypothetical protein PVAP13_7KG051918 [Panicum virgatum]|uniref:Uncharacterized protein n=1 Tax=Panicum virgatum TaxID=38727 RepID=A0A8T0QDN0_PANVG|nr:hypothetical protein PVAP13_7KG051918 [Panicum virgatum]